MAELTVCPHLKNVKIPSEHSKELEYADDVTLFDGNNEETVIEAKLGRSVAVSKISLIHHT